MEVDLVICFDANISSLRMIQRMGRTGRKHDGRVVVLACEGSELKGYLRKQANSKSINKHMRNGGMNSFHFHSSPRMIPHIFKPEVQFVELSIEQFVSRGKKVKDDLPNQTPSFKAKLTDEEADLVAKYFQPTRETAWKPSLIAFPHFQAFPSRVHEVMHSLRTEMLIETMRHLQELSFQKDEKDETSSDLCLRAEFLEQRDHIIEDLQNKHMFPEVPSPRAVSKSDETHEISRTLEKHVLPGFQGRNVHSYLFGSDFVSVDALGRVFIVSVPLLPVKKLSHSRSGSVPLINHLNQDSSQRDSLGDDIEMVMQMKDVSDRTDPTRTNCKQSENPLTSRSWEQDVMEKEEDETDRIIQTPISEKDLTHEGDGPIVTPYLAKNGTPVLFSDESSDDLRDIELSPRLSNFITSGVVPESPIDDSGISKGRGRGDFAVPNAVSPNKLHIRLLSESPEPNNIKRTVFDGSTSGGDVLASAIHYESQSLETVKINNSSPRGCTAPLPVIEEIHTPLANSSNNSCSKDWRLSSGDKSESVEQEHKFKRLRKYGDLCKRRVAECEEENICPEANLARVRSSISPDPVWHGRGKKQLEDVRAFIEEEAEVSSEVAVSDDEEDEQHTNSYDDSFIDDRIDPTAANTQAEDSRSDMMAVYRRSLLSQSPMERLPSCHMEFSPDSIAPNTRITESGSSSGTINHQNLTCQPVTESSGKNSVSFQLNTEKISSDGVLCTVNRGPIESEGRMGSRKRKLSFYQVGSVPSINLEQEFLFQCDAAGGESHLPGQEEKTEANGYSFDDDEFYASLDFDAVEEEAAKLLRYKSELISQKKTVNREPAQQNLSVLSPPSFDLGI